MNKFDLPIRAFKTDKEFEKYLAKHYADEQGIWIRLYKKASGVKSINYAEALDVALCYGWIDGQVQRYDEKSYLQRFTPRRSRSPWSQRNIEHIARLTKAGRMKPPGLAAVAEAKKNGRWASAYSSASNAQVPDDFLKALDENKKAKEFYKTLNKTNLYAIYYRVNDAKKPETRAKRIETIIKMLSKHQKFH